MAEARTTTIPVVEEELTVSKRAVRTGAVRIETRTELVDAVAAALLESSDVEVVRVAVGREVDEAPGIRTEGDTTIVPVLEEVLVVQKRLVLKEEIHIKRRVTTERVEMPVTLRKQTATVSRSGDQQSPQPSPQPSEDNPMSETYPGSATTSMASSNTLTAFFDTRADAQDAASRLRDLGIADASIRIVGDETRTTGETYERGDSDKGFFESLSDFFFPDDDRATYAEGLRRGGTLLTVSDIPAGMYDQTLDILDDEGSIDIDTRAADWRSEGWSSESFGMGSTAAAGAAMADRSVADTAYGASESTASTYAATDRVTALDDSATLGGTARTDALRSDRDEEVIPVVEEQLRVGKRDVNLGRVRVRSYVVEEPVNESVNLHEERVFVERRPVDRTLAGTEAAFTDQVIEAEEHAEEAVVSKEARVKEEIALRREAEERTETVSDTVRRTEVEIEDERLEAERLTGTGERRTTDKI